MKNIPLPLMQTKKQSELKGKAPTFHRSRTIKEGLNSSSEIQALIHIERLKEQLAILEKDLQVKNAIKSKNQILLDEQTIQIKSLTQELDNQIEILAEFDEEHQVSQLRENIDKEQKEIYVLQFEFSRLEKKTFKVERFAEEKANVLQKLLSEYITLNVDENSNSRSDSESYHLTPSKSNRTKTFKKSQFSQIQFNQTPSGTPLPRAHLLSVKFIN